MHNYTHTHIFPLVRDTKLANIHTHVTFKHVGPIDSSGQASATAARGRTPARHAPAEPAATAPHTRERWDLGGMGNEFSSKF